MAVRYDVSPLNKPRRNADGSVSVDVRLTRTGIFTYRNADGTTRRELRTPEEVFAPAAMESFELVPVTNDHPAEMVTPANYASLQKGAVSGPRRDGRFVRGVARIYDADLVTTMGAGKVQVSCGYTCELDFTPGIYNGEKYDAIQRNIVGNHLAVVDSGRAGAECAVRMDATPTDPEKEITMTSVTLNGIKFDVEDSLAQALVSTTDKLTARADVAEAAAVASEKARAEAVAGVPAAVKARVDLETLAGKHGVKVDSQSDLELRSAIAIALGAVIPAAKKDSAAYVEAVLDTALAIAGKSGGALDKARVVIDAVTKTVAVEKEAADVVAKAKMKTDLNDAWKTSTSAVVRK